MQTTAGSLFGNTSSTQEMLTKQMPTMEGVTGQQQLDQAQLQATQPSQSQPSAVTPSSSAGVAAGGGTKLTDKDLEAFKADKFTLGQIPEHAPPEALCN